MSAVGRDSEETRVILDLGRQPLANALLDHPEMEEVREPLRLVVDPSASWRVRIDHTLSPERLFRHYVYASSVSEGIVAAARDSTERYARKFKLGRRSLVVELGCNDGYWLEQWRSAGVPCLGVDPAENLVTSASRAGLDVVCDFFSERLGMELAAGRKHADLVVGNNVLAHVPDPADFLRGVRHLLKPGGTAVFEFPYLRDLIDGLEFDTIYHEHVHYFSLQSVRALVEEAGLEVWHVERVPVHGGSLRLFVGRPGGHDTSPRVGMLAAEESAIGMDTMEYYETFGARVEACRRQINAMLAAMKKSGWSIAAYGAAAKGTVLLNYCLPPDGTLDVVVDRSPLKQGKWTPGLRLPIVSPSWLDSHHPEVLLLLAWNMAPEIVRQNLRYFERGGRLLLPLPHPRLLALQRDESRPLRPVRGLMSLPSTHPEGIPEEWLVPSGGERNGR